ncbi:MAG TPA: hypothetical protein VD838_14570, partial [Anaeromyxobacteraceae bacterium]|nr:hypothetical protein [Anaeromyxobacteraceae bacterium]
MRLRPILATALLSAMTSCAVEGGGGAERRYTSAGSSDDPSHGTAVLADGRVEYEVTAWHFTDGTHLDATIRNRGPGVL